MWFPNKFVFVYHWSYFHNIMLGQLFFSSQLLQMYITHNGRIIAIAVYVIIWHDSLSAHYEVVLSLNLFSLSFCMLGNSMLGQLCFTQINMYIFVASIWITLYYAYFDLNNYVVFCVLHIHVLTLMSLCLSFHTWTWVHISFFTCFHLSMLDKRFCF